MVCSNIWSMLSEKLPTLSNPKHLLWALLFLRRYEIEEVNVALTNVDAKTCRKWIWTFIDLLADLPVIKLDNRYVGRIEGQNTYVSLDGTDCPIYEPSPFNPKWFSHKFKGAGLRYEVGLCIQTGYIVWVNGGVPCGEYSDLKLARMAFTDMLDEDELTVADKGYADLNYFIYPNDYNSSNARIKQIMSRHETVNMRLKTFKVLAHVFRHKLFLHPRCFHAVANITQIMIENGEPLFDI